MDKKDGVGRKRKGITSMDDDVSCVGETVEV